MRRLLPGLSGDTAATTGDGDVVDGNVSGLFCAAASAAFRLRIARRCGGSSGPAL